MIDRRTVHNLVFQLIKQEHYASAQALILANCEDDRLFVDRVIQFYVDRGAQNWFCGYDDFCRAFALLPLKPSRRVCDALLRAFIKVGFHNHAAGLAEHLGRTLTPDEVRALCTKYTGGAVQSRTTEQDILELARTSGGELLIRECRDAIEVMRKRWENDLF